MLVLGCGAIAFTAWLVLFLGAQASPPRLAYLALPAWVAFVALALLRLPRRFGLAGVAVLLLAINVWTLHAISAVKPPSYDLPAIAAMPPDRESPTTATASYAASRPWPSGAARTSAGLGKRPPVGATPAPPLPAGAGAAGRGLGEPPAGRAQHAALDQLIDAAERLRVGEVGEGAVELERVVAVLDADLGAPAAQDLNGAGTPDRGAGADDELDDRAVKLETGGRA